MNGVTVSRITSWKARGKSVLDWHHLVLLVGGLLDIGSTCDVITDQFLQLFIFFVFVGKLIIFYQIISAFIFSRSVVRVVLSNEGSRKHSEYGAKIAIERTISKSGSSYTAKSLEFRNGRCHGKHYALA